jgi:sugar lactone lactonase YvrE
MPMHIEIFAEGLDHAEGLAVHPDGSVWCGGEIGQIYRIDPSGRNVVEVASTGGLVLGLAFSPDTNWLAICDAERKSVLRLELSTMKITTFAETVEDWRFNLPNYPVFGLDGTLYVSESGGSGKTTGRIFRFDPSGNGHLWAGGSLNFANGLALDRGESYLYVVESFWPGVSRFRIMSDGSAGDREIFAQNLREVPDGLAFDCEGNLYCSCYAPSRIYKIDPKGCVTVLADDPTCCFLSNCTNIAFGGADFQTLYVANFGSHQISRIELDVKGLPLACHARS